MFVCAATYRFEGKEPNNIVAADFNGDGTLDLAEVGKGGVHILLGNGDGTFQSPQKPYTDNSKDQSLQYGSGVSWLAMGDFNRDGYMDLVVANEFSGVSVLLGNGDGTFREPLITPAGNSLAHLAVGDLNGDGIPDLAVVALFGGVGVLLGNGDGTFQTPVWYPTWYASWCVAIGDLDNDGHLDLVVTSRGVEYEWVTGEGIKYTDHSGLLSVLMNRGDGTFAEAVNYRINAEGGEPYRIVLADLNADGNLDMAMHHVESHKIGVWLGTGGGRLEADYAYELPSQLFSLAVGAFTGAGGVDLVASCEGGQLCILPSQGDGTFNTPLVYENVPAGEIAVGDFDRDGRPDIAVTYYNEISILLNRVGGPETSDV